LDLCAVGKRDLGMADAPIEACEQSGGLGRDDGGFEVGTGEGADGGEGAPGGLDENFGFACGVTHGNCCAEKAIDAAKFRQDGLGKVLEVFGQLRFGGAGRPVTCDRADRDCGCCALLVANDDFPGPHFPSSDQAVYDIRVFAGEGFDFAAVIDVKNEERAIHGIVEGATEDQFASVAMLSRDAQMLFAEFGAARDVVVHGFINQGIVVHNLPLSDLRTIANGRSDPWEVFQDFDRVERWGAKRFCSGLVVNPDRVEDVFQGCQRIFGEGDFVNHVFIR